MARSTSSTRRRRRSAGPEPDALGFYGYKVADVMTHPVIRVPPSASLAQAARRMSRKGISGLAVVAASGEVVGVLSQKDILRVLGERAGLRVPGGIFDLILHPSEAGRADLARACRRELDRGRVRDAMSHPAVTVAPGATLDDAVKLLVASKINRLPVVRGRRLVGIVTRTDLLGGLTTPGA